MLKRKNLLKTILALLLYALSAHAEACSTNNRYWVAADDGTDKFWHDNANWSCTNNGPGGASTPNQQNKTAIFNSNSSVNVKLNANVPKINKLNLISGYAGTINLNGCLLYTSPSPRDS